MLRAVPVLLMLAGAVQAATFNFNGVVPICPLTGTTYNCASLPNNSDTDVVIIASGYTVIVTAPISFTYNQQFSMSGTASLQSSTGSINLATINPSSLNVSGGTLVAKTSLAVGVKAITADLTAGSLTGVSNSKITGSISVAGDVQLQSATTIIGSLSGGTIVTGSGSSFTGEIKATNSFTLASAGKVVGNITAPVVNILASPSTVTGNIKASTSLKLESGATVNGNVSGGSLQMDPSPVVINGDATMTGDVDIGSGDTINGNLTARNVMTRDSNVYIKGNAIVNAITLNYAAKVGDTIYCTAPGSVNCSCVTNNSGYGMPAPKCAAGPPPASGGPHHIQITHSGQALTCQAQPVTLTACSDAACSSVYNGSTSVTLTPGGGPAFSFNGTTSATVRNPTATGSTGTPLSAAVSGMTSANVCPNASTSTNNCNMVFKDAGLTISAPDHVAMTAASLSVQALKSDPAVAGSCVPLVKKSTVKVNFSCKYNNPNSGAASSPVIINGTDVACGSGSTIIDVAFDEDGLATPSLKYAEVGKVDVSAVYTGTGSNANLAASGSDDFIAAPASFKIEATRVTTGGSFVADVFGNPGDLFTLKVSALNAATPPAVTSNFGKESSPESFILDAPVLKFPTGGVKPYIAGTFAAISGGVGNSASGVAGQWHFDDVGTITLNAKLANPSTYYMGKTFDGFATKGTLDLRFVPHHFNTALAGVNLMDCTKVGLVNPCAPLNTSGKFMYSKQNFDLRVIAYNDAASTSVSQNYVDKVGLDAEAVAKKITVSLWTTSGGTAPATINNGGFTPNVGFAFSKGVGVATTAPLPAVSFNYNLPDTETAPTTVFIRAADTDTVTSQRATGSVEAPLTVVSGRMQVTNNYGSATSPLPVKVQAQYYSGSAGAYLFNPQFPPISPADEAKMTIGDRITYINCQKGLAVSGNICPAPGPTATLVRPHAGVLIFNAGNASFLLAAPKLSGSVDVRLEPDGWTPAAASPIPFLPSSAYGRQTFGIYRSGPVIYTREVHN